MEVRVENGQLHQSNKLKDQVPQGSHQDVYVSLELQSAL